MTRSNTRKRFLAAAALLCAATSIASQAGTLSATPAAARVAMKPYPIQTEARKELARKYSSLHYGIDSWRLSSPKMIIVHYTATDSDSVSLSVFKPERLGSSRPDIIKGGELNVSVHYVITRDGAIWSLMPETDMARHAVGYNHLALGIEMTGEDAKSLTEAQLRSCAALVADIAARNPSIEYLCGHHEYMQASRAHLGLYTELMPGYLPPVKIDPGDEFMSSLRARLKYDYSITLKD